VTTQTGKFVLVSGIHGGREVFLGRPIDQPYDNTLTIEGKSVCFTPQGVMLVRPFVTLCTFPTTNPNCSIQQITNTEATQEATSICSLSLTTLGRASYPLMYRWIESAIGGAAASALGPMNGYSPYGMSRTGAPKGGYNAWNNPFTSFYEGFAASAEQFRRALFQTPQVTSTRELDKLTELEGEITIEVGKITNQIAVKFNLMVSRANELAHYFEAIQGFGVPFSSTGTVGGWCYLMNRIQIAKNWARKTGKTPLVREINALTKEAINGLNEVILEHCSALDTLITETCTQHGIQFEVHGEMSPFASYTTPYSGTVESLEPAGIPAYAGAGA
jgi:hypothetical protein